MKQLSWLLAVVAPTIFAAPFVAVPTVTTGSCSMGLSTVTAAPGGCAIAGTNNTAVGSVGYANFYALPTPNLAAGSDVEVNDAGGSGQITSVSSLYLLTNTSAQMGSVTIGYSALANVFSGSGTASLSFSVDGQTVLNCVLAACQSGSVTVPIEIGGGNIFDLILTQTSQAGNGFDSSALAKTTFSANFSFFDANGNAVTADLAPAPANAPEPATALIALPALAFFAALRFRARR